MGSSGNSVLVAQPSNNPFMVAFSLFKLTKPAVTIVLVLTAVMTGWAASGPWVSPLRLLMLAIAGGLMAGGAASLNQYFEQDLDSQMPRTSHRPLPSGSVTQGTALAWGALLCVTSLVLSLAWLSLEATFFIVAGLFIYVPIYTLSLKRRTIVNVVLGGAAGACPVLAGWAAVRADWPITPFALAALIFFWTPAHFWAYAMVYNEGYKSASIPMLPAQIGLQMTVPHIAAHIALMVIASALAVQGLAFVITMVGNVLFIVFCIRLWRAPSGANAFKLYKFSNSYLLLVFMSMALGSALGL